MDNPQEDIAISRPTEFVNTPLEGNNPKFSFTSLDSVRKRLLDLSARNNLLNYKHPKSSCLRIIDELPDQIFEVLNTAGSKFTFIPVPEPTEQQLVDAGYIKLEPSTRKKTISEYPTAERWAKHISLSTFYDLPEPNKIEGQTKHNDQNLQTLLYAPELEARLRAIRATAETSIEESGANILYLALGFLEWYESRDSDVARLAPLFTLPVQMERSDLDRKSGAYRYTLQLKDDNLISNVTLREKLASDFGLILPPIADDTTPESYFEQIRNTILQHQPRWKLRRQASLVLLNFTKQAMYEDLDPKNWPANANIEKHPLIQQFFASEGEECDCGLGFTYESEYEMDTIEDVHVQYPLIYDADSSQHSAIVDVVNGESLVIEGPPGSGKSQTITNLIAASISNGEKVLFVAEKMAALNVVKSRLDKAGLGDFCLEIHSHKTNKQKILSDLNVRLSKQEQYAPPKGIDSDIERYEYLKQKLNCYAEKINSIWQKTGMSIHAILQRATRLREQYSINPDSFMIDGLSGENLTTVRQNELGDYAFMLGSIYGQIAAQADEGRIENHLWYGIGNPSLSSHEQEELLVALEEWTASLLELKSAWQESLEGFALEAPETASISEIERFASVGRSLPDLFGGEAFDRLDELNQRHDEIKEWLDAYSDIHADIEEIGKKIHVAALYDTSTPEALSKIIQFLKSLGFPEGGTIANLAEDSATLNKASQLAAEVDGILKVIRSNAPERIGRPFLATWNGLTELTVFISLLERLPLDLYKHRDEVFDDPDMDGVLSNLRGHFKIAIPVYIRLKDRITLDRLPSSGVLKNHLAILEGGGFFRWFSSVWRESRRAVIGFSTNSKPNGKEVIALLPDMILFAEEQEKIEKVVHDNPVLGSQYQGMDTPIDRIAELREWYKAVRVEYGIGFGERVEIGNQILKLDRQFALSLIDEGNKGLKDKIHSLLALLSRSSEGYPNHPIRKNRDGDLVSPGGPLTKLLSDLTKLLERLSKIAKTKDLTLSELKSFENSIRGVLADSGEWNGNDLRNLVRPFDRHLTLAKEGFSEVDLRSARNVLAIARIVSGSEHLATAIRQETTELNYDRLRNSAARMASHLDRLVSCKRSFGDKGRVNFDLWLASREDTIPSMAERNRKASDNKNWLTIWLDYVRLKDRLYGEGFRNFIHVIESSGMDCQNLQDIVSLVCCHQLSKEIFQKHPELVNFTGLEQTAIQQRFREYDNKLLKLQRMKIAHRSSKNRPPVGVATGKVSDYSEVSLIKHEVTKKTKHIAVRSLMKRAGKAILALKPCFMMSPMSVAQYLEPGRFHFDLVVMDEASQIRPEDALGAIARGTKLVVVGDPKQLPPTNFFNKMVDDGTEEEIVGLQDSESILESVMPMFKTRRLRWHYRSKHESLIAFSNKHFYDDDLVIFPSPFKSSPEFGVKLIHVGHGRFASGRNVEEARELVKSVGMHLKSNPHESVGLVAMNAEQRDEIERQLDQLAKDDLALLRAIEENMFSEEPLFIKNLENVQGDERDVIYISMTYGPESVGGRTMQRFGPINSDVGWRRLNVLFTRSKKRMHVFSSMTSGDVLAGAGSSRGVHALKAFLEYTENGHLHNSVRTYKEADSDFEIAVMNALGNYGYECEPQLGVAGFFLDIAVRDPGKSGRFLLGIECDGATYHSAKSARDRDRLRQEVLESLGWKIYRIWSTDWFKNPQVQLRPILNELEKLKTSVSEMEETNEIVAEMVTVEEEAEAIQDQISDIEQITDMSLRDRLLAFNEAHIKPIFPDTPEEKRLLRQDMVDALLEHLPCSKAEFLELIPAFLRTGTSTEEAKLLEPVLKLVSDYA